MGATSVVTVTLGQVAAAITVNGFPKYKNGFFGRTADGKDAACALGQCAYNLGVEPGALQRALEEIEVFDESGRALPLGDWIIHRNDKSDDSVKAIGEQATKRIAAIDQMPLTIAAKDHSSIKKGV